MSAWAGARWLTLLLAGACSQAPQPQAAVRYTDTRPVTLPRESGSFVLDLWLEGNAKLQIASAGTGRVDVDIEFEDGDRQDLTEWTLVGEVQLRPINLPGEGTRPARLHFRRLAIRPLAQGAPVDATTRPGRTGASPDSVVRSTDATCCS